MRRELEKKVLERMKLWFFELVFILDLNKFVNKKLLLVVTFLQLILSQYFYFHASISNLFTLQTISIYLTNYRSFIFPIVASSSQTISLLILSIPFIFLLALLISKQIFINRIVVLLISIFAFIFPLFFIKIILEAINLFQTNNIYLYLAIFSAITALLFSTLSLSIYDKKERFLDIFCILVLELKAPVYVIMPMLAIRLLVLFLIGRKSPQKFFHWMNEVSLYTILVSTFLCDENLSNYISFMLLAGMILILSTIFLISSVMESTTIFQHLEEVEENQDAYRTSIRSIEEHRVLCEKELCTCQQLASISQHQFRSWTFKFWEENMRAKESFTNRAHYAEQCCQIFDFQLKGLIRLYQLEPENLKQQYTVFKISATFQYNLKKQDKNQKFGVPFVHIAEDIEIFHQKLFNATTMIKQFWKMIKDFDGTSKFLDKIIQISKGIQNLNEDFGDYQNRYEDSANFSYLFTTFKSIIMNESLKTSESIVVLPEETLYLIVNAKIITHANSEFCAFANTSLSNLIGKNYNIFIPESYRESHQQYALAYLNDTKAYSDQYIQKIIQFSSFDLKIVQMQHKIFPRFSDGIQIFTIIQYNEEDQLAESNFVILIEKKTYRMLNVQSKFFKILQFKKNQKSSKLLHDLKVTQVFNHFSLNFNENPSKEVIISKPFAQQYTNLNTSNEINSNNLMKTRQRDLNKNKNHYENFLFSYEILQNLNKEDPNCKVLFKRKDLDIQVSKKKKIFNQNDSKISSQQQNEEILKDKKQKQEKEIISFRIPYYLILMFLALHLIYLQITSIYEKQFNNLQNRFNFLLSFQQSILNDYGASEGINNIDQIKKQWIAGFGDFSESFNAMRNTKDPLFHQYFTTNVSITFHNALYFQIQSQLTFEIQNLATFNQAFYIILFISLGCLIVDFILSIRYTFKVQSKVSKILIKFLIVSPADIKQIILMIENFIKHILKNKEYEENQKDSIKEQSQDSAIGFFRGSMSSNNASQSDVLELQNLIEEDTHKRSIFQKRSRKNSEKRNSIAIDDIKANLFVQQVNAKKISFVLQPMESQGSLSQEKIENIKKFINRYESFTSILATNKTLYILLLTSIIFACAALTVTILILPKQIQSFSNNLQLFNQIQLTQVTLYKSLIQKYVNTPLQPPFTLSLQTLQLKNLVANLPSEMSSFRNELSQVLLSGDICNFLLTKTNSTCQNISTIVKSYGIDVINQYLQEYLRTLTNSSQLSIRNSFFKVFQVQLQVLAVLSNDFVTSANVYQTTVTTIELKFIIIGIFLMLIGFIANHIVLNCFQNKIESSNQLLNIIPDLIKNKQDHSQFTHEIEKQLNKR